MRAHGSADRQPIRFRRDSTVQSRELKSSSGRVRTAGQIRPLIGHGFRRGYAERGSEVEVRGRRFFCSNRHRRPGCGRTFSVLLAAVVSRFVVRAVTLFRFVEFVVSGLTCHMPRWRAASARVVGVERVPAVAAARTRAERAAHAS